MKEAIAILTGGGPAPGINTVVASVSKTFLKNGYRVIGLHTGYTSLLSIELDTEDIAKVSAVADACRLFRIGVSWGGFESLILPQYNGKNAENLRDAHIPLGLVRLYVGLENPADLTADLENALNAMLA